LISWDGNLGNLAQKKLQVLFLTNWYPNQDNPVEGIHVQEIIRAVSIYHSVAVIHNCGADPKLDQPWKIEQQKTSSLTRGLRTYQFRYRSYPNPRTNFILSAWFLLQAVRWIKKNDWKPDILHAHVYHVGIVAAFIGKIMQIPVVISEHSSKFPRDRLSRFGLLVARTAFRLAKVVAPVSTALKDAIINSGIRGNFQVIPNVVDDEIFFFKIKNRKPNLRFLYIGLLDLSDNKGISILFQALKQYLQKDNNWQLDIIGDGPGREKYQEMVLGSDLSDKITFHGMKSKPEIASFMGEADLFILPSIKETFSVVTAEALATGTPVLVTKCGGPEDYVNQTNGILVEASDPGALYDGLLRSIESLDSYDNEQIASDALQRFSPHVIGEQYTKIYHDVLTGF